MLEKLKKYNQEHLLMFYDSLSEDERNKLTNDIESIDFETIEKIYKNSYINESVDLTKVSPLKIYKKEEINKDYYKNIGENLISNCALLTLAGGSGTRLGHNGPKGTYILNINGEELSIFELFINELKRIKNKYGIYLPWYIMTGVNNHKETVEFFKSKSYFHYPKDKIKFFKQGELPVLDIKGHCVLKNKYTILKESDGNGSLFKALKYYNLVEYMKEDNIKYVEVSNIDNILTRAVDPIFVGLMEDNHLECGVKSFFKEEAMSKDFIFCKYDSKPIMLDYSDITEELSNRKENNEYLYRDINSAIQIFTVDALDKLSNKTLPYHRAYKNYNYIDVDGKETNTEEKNSFKFEHFNFDAFQYFDDLLVYRVDKETEFAPIKNKVGTNTPETAIEIYLKTNKNNELN